MGIRVNPDMYSIVLNGLQVNSQQQKQALQQVASGQKLNSLSDDPAAAASLVNLRMQSSSNTQYLQNISSLTGSLNVAGSALSSVVEALTVAQTVGVEGTSSTLNGSNRQALAQQVGSHHIMRTFLRPPRFTTVGIHSLDNHFVF